jgi:hypothetical protein
VIEWDAHLQRSRFFSRRLGNLTAPLIHGTLTSSPPANTLLKPGWIDLMRVQTPVHISPEMLEHVFIPVVG